MNLKANICVMSALIFILAMSLISLANAQEYIVLENDRGVQKSSFTRGEGIVIAITIPYNAEVEVWLHNPPGTPGPSPTLFIPRTSLRASIQEKLGPKWMDEKAPCGKYRLEIRIFQGGAYLKSEYKYFDYAIDEPPCTPPTTTVTTVVPPPIPINGLIIGTVGGLVVVVVVLVAFLLLRQRAPPPKERAPALPPTAPPAPPPSTAPPPKAPHRRTPIVRAEHREEE